MSLFFNKDDHIYCDQSDNIAYKKIMKCVYTDANTAQFNNGDITITLGQYQESLDGIKAIRITEKENPEYFL